MSIPLTRFAESGRLPTSSTVRSPSAHQLNLGTQATKPNQLNLGTQPAKPNHLNLRTQVTKPNQLNLSTQHGSSEACGGLYRSRSGSNHHKLSKDDIEESTLDTPTGVLSEASKEGGGLEARFGIRSGGLEGLSELFGREWNLDPTTGVLDISDAALRRITNPDPIEKWYILDPEPIARGQFAVVYRCQHRISGVHYAAKFTSLRRHGVDATRDVKHEVAVSAMLTACHRTVRPHDVFAATGSLVLVMELAPGGDLQTVLDEDILLYERDVIGFIRQLLQGLVYIHGLGLVHLDIKPQNLVLMGDSTDSAVKLCDFEISRMVSGAYEIREILGTPDYIAPEIIHYEPITTKTDMWSLGVLTYALLTGFLPFGGETDQETCLEISLGNYDFPEEFFEDISAHAISFIQHLLVRCPSQRMSAAECLEHPWMKAEIKKVNLPAINVNPTTPQHLSLPIQAPQPPKCLTLPNTPTANWNVLDEWTKHSSNYSNNNSSRPNVSHTPSVAIPLSTVNPNILSPVNMTPTIMTPVSSSPRELNFPTQRPYISYRPNTSTHSSTHSLYRGDSRQNLDRLRSQSKSREVLVERLQLSKQKKTISRSRERLYDGHYALHRSREHLINNRSFSQSVEELQPYDWLNDEDEIYKSLNSVYLPMLLPIRKQTEEDVFTRKLYNRLASTEKIDEVINENPESNYKTNLFDSRNSVNSMTDDQYNNYLSRLYPVVRKSQEETRNLSRTSGQGGRNTEPRDRHYSKHDKEPSTVLTQPLQKRNQPETVSIRTNEQKKRKENEIVKNERRKQQKENPKSKTLTTQKSERTPTQPVKNNNTGNKRRGSVSHTEQRIQERHERMLERTEKQKKQDKKILTRSNSVKEKQRRHSAESEKTQSSFKSKDRNNTTGSSTRRNSFPARPQPKNIQKKNISVDTTPSTSLESVKENKILKRSLNGTTKFSKCNNNNKTGLYNRTPENSTTGKIGASDTRGDIDEAYVSLEETVDDGIFSRSESMESSTTTDSNHTLQAQCSSSDTLDTTFQDLLIAEIEKDQSEMIDEKISTAILHGRSNVKNVLTVEVTASLKTSDQLNNNLTIIKEDENTSKSFTRSVSTSSDIGSMLSEGSDLAFEENQRKISLTKECNHENVAESGNRIRSHSVQTTSAFPPIPFKLSRSNSVHLDTPLSGVPRPWGEVCQGSIHRALTMFRQQSTESNSSGSSCSSRRRSSNWSNAEGLDQIVEKNKIDDDTDCSPCVTTPIPVPPPPPPPPPPPLSCSKSLIITKVNNKKHNYLALKSSPLPLSPPLPSISLSLFSTTSPSLLRSSSSSALLISTAKPKLPFKPSSIPIRRL